MGKFFELGAEHARGVRASRLVLQNGGWRRLTSAFLAYVYASLSTLLQTNCPNVGHDATAPQKNLDKLTICVTEFSTLSLPVGPMARTFPSI
jgi:hypothetical protein